MNLLTDPQEHNSHRIEPLFCWSEPVLVSLESCLSFDSRSGHCPLHGLTLGACAASIGSLSVCLLALNLALQAIADL